MRNNLKMKDKEVDKINIKLENIIHILIRDKHKIRKALQNLSLTQNIKLNNQEVRKNIILKIHLLMIKKLILLFVKDVIFKIILGEKNVVDI